MSTKIAAGASQDGIVIGNTFDKYNSRNPIVRWLMNGFETSLNQLVTLAKPTSIHEIGCGEGHWTLHWNKLGYHVRGCDFSSQVIEIARENALKSHISPEIFETRSIYDLKSPRDNSDLIICCEVLEHLEKPAAGMLALQSITDGYLILSVPREPLWRALNFCRAKYLLSLGNTPGHIQHWSKNSFIDFVAQYFEIIEIRSPIPWTMVLCRPKR